SHLVHRIGEAEHARGRRHIGTNTHRPHRIPHHCFIGASTKVCSPPPTGPCTSDSVERARADPVLPSCVSASIRIHSPTTGRARCTSRSTLTNDQSFQSSSAEMPLAE